MDANVYLALVHYPVINKHGREIVSAVTNLDLHDIARAAVTYGIKGFYVVTPSVDQQELAATIIAHWRSGFGATYNTKRREAFARVWIKSSLADVTGDIQVRENGRQPQTVATTSRRRPASVSFGTLQQNLANAYPHLLLFGTAWGLTDGLLNEADLVLEPIAGPAEYNHLSVRAAAAVVLDRLLGRR